MRSVSSAQSCGHRGRRSTAAAVVADGAARQLKALHEKTSGVSNPCSFRTAYTDAGVFAFEVNGNHGSVQGWEDYSAHAGDAGIVIRNYHTLMSPIGTAIRRRTTVKYRQPSTSTVLWTVSYSLSSSRTIGFAVLLVLRRFYCFINNISATPQAHMNSCWRSIVTMALSRVVSEILNVEKCRDLEIPVNGHSTSLKVVQFDRLGMVFY